MNSRISLKHLKLADNDFDCVESNDDCADMCSGEFESEIDALDVLEN